MVLPQDSYLRFGPYLDLMTGIRTALKINEGIIKLVAQEGSGKTVFCRELVRELEEDGQKVIFFATPPESVDYLHKRIQSELDLPRDKNFTRTLTEYLLAKPPPHNKLTIIYDDAEKISKDIFILIRLLNNVHNDSETLVSQVICGTSQLDRVFDDPGLRSLTQYLNQSFTLSPMTREELEDFCSGYLKKSGITGKDLTSKQLTDVFMSGKGMPGKTMEILSRQAESSNTVSTLPGKEDAPESSAEIAEPVAKSPAPAREDAATYYAREVDEILEEDTGSPSSIPMYFKLVLSVVVVVSTIVLAVVLSRDNEAVNSHIAEILADDSPLYLDEVTQTTTDQSTNTPVPLAEEAEALPAVATPADNEIEPENLAAITQTSPADESTSLSMPAAVAEDQSPPEPTPAPTSDNAITVADSDQADESLISAIETTTPEIPVKPEENSSDELNETVSEEVPVAENRSSPELVDDIEPEVSIADEPVEVTAEITLEETINETVRVWTQAWQNGEFAAYIGAYHEDFSATNYETLAAWEEARKPRVDGVSGMTISFDRFTLLSEEAEQASAQFWLYYSRGSYADETLKEIVFQRENDDWLILEERNLEINVK